MIKIEAETLEIAYSKASEKLECSITQLNVEVVQAPTSGFLGLFKKRAIIVATSKVETAPKQKISEDKPAKEIKEENVVEKAEKVQKPEKVVETPVAKDVKAKVQEKVAQPKIKVKKKKSTKKEPSTHNDLILPASFVTDQEEDDYDGSELYADEEEIYVGEETKICDKSHDEIHQQLAGSFKNSQANDNFFGDNKEEKTFKPSDVAAEIKQKVESLFEHACFEIDEIKVEEHDANTILVEFTGKDAALLIGKEGYRYKALSYMLYNWINAVYQLQLRLEIAEFLKNQEEMIAKYLEAVFINIDRDGKAQTKILDGVLVQIALRNLRTAYPDKYVAIRSTRDGAKFIIINSFNN